MIPAHVWTAIEWMLGQRWSVSDKAGYLRRIGEVSSR